MAAILSRLMELWEVMRWLHLVAMALFVGGQLMLAAVVVPVMRGDDRMRLIARNFGMATVAAIALAVLTGMSLASELGRWQDPALHAKLGLLVLVGVIIAVHMRRPGSRALGVAMLVVSLAIVAFGVALAHGG
jgi:putative copper export protein